MIVCNGFFFTDSGHPYLRASSLDQSPHVLLPLAQDLPHQVGYHPAIVVHVKSPLTIDWCLPVALGVPLLGLGDPQAHHDAHGDDILGCKYDLEPQLTQLSLYLQVVLCLGLEDQGEEDDELL